MIYKITSVRTFFVLVILLSGWHFQSSFAQEKSSAGVIRVTCVGASITEGARIENPKEYSYPGQLQTLLGKG